MKIFDFPQRSPEWFEIRKGVITASRVGMFCAEPFGICLTVPEIKSALDAQGIAYKGLTKRDDLLSILPNADAYRRLVDPAQALIDEIMGEQADGDDRPPDFDTFWTKRGTEMEPIALADYERRTGYTVEPVGFILHDCGKFGCSPDGLVSAKTWSLPKRGLEIKCPEGKTHLRYLREGVLPNEYVCQVHASMAVTGLDRWDFFSFHPNLPPLLLTVERDNLTDNLERGLLLLAMEMRRQEIALAAKWREEFENIKDKERKP